MAINPALLIAAPMLQDYFVDKILGTPLAGGIVTCYQDNSRTTLKNWYYQAGTPGAYTYVPLNNPLTLSSVGTIVDVNGFDTIPFFYPYSETDNQTVQRYFITVYAADPTTGLPTTEEFTRQNFPYNITSASGGSGNTSVTAQNNLIANSAFYHNIGTINTTTDLNAIIAPDNHDGFAAAMYSDVRFIKNIAGTGGASDQISFVAFGQGAIPLYPDQTPEYYLNYTCSGVQAGETIKCVQIPLQLHIKTIESMPAVLTIYAQNDPTTGGVNNMLTLKILQFTGTGAVTASVPVPIGTIMTTNSWQQYIIPFTFPASSGLDISSTGDDGLFLQIGYPLSATSSINIAEPAVYLGSQFPAINYQTYDQIDRIISSPRTGDYRLSLNAFFPFGWVPCNDGTIGDASSNASTRANRDTWQLYNLIWNAVGYTYAPMYTSAGVPTGTYGASAYADWNANNQIALTKTLGRVLASTGIAGSINYILGQTAGAEGYALQQSNFPSGPLQGQLGVVTSPPYNTGSNTLESNQPTIAGGTLSSATLTLNTGTQNLISTYQPTTFVNVFLKL